jgi:CheY-like chemotaxis protein
MSKQIVCFLVDDDKDDQEIFEIAIQQSGRNIKLLTADDGYIALQQLRQDVSFVPDFIFLDLNMPRVNGLQCLEEIKTLEHLKNTPAYIYTTSTSLIHKHQAISLGASDFLTKPSHINDLTALLEGIFIRN